MSKKSKDLKKFRKKEQKRMAEAYIKEHGYQRHAYLDELGMPLEKQWTNFVDASDSRFETWKKEQKKYGFDSRETWNLNDISAQFLYERLRCYQDINIIDMNYHTFEFDGETYTQKEAVDYILDNLRLYIKTDELKADAETAKKAAEAGKNAFRMWAEILPAMWW